MSSNNDNSGMMALAFVIGGLALIGMFIYAVLVFLALAFTIIAIIAWREPLTLFGETVTPEEARTFVARGIAGAILLPLFVAFCSVLFGFRVDPNVWNHLVLAGYALGSLGIGIAEAQQQEEERKRQAARQALLPPQPPPPPSPVLPRQEAEPFHYARWDDEDEFRS